MSMVLAARQVPADVNATATVCGDIFEIVF